MGADLGRYGEPILPGAVNMPPTTRSSVMARPSPVAALSNISGGVIAISHYFDPDTRGMVPRPRTSTTKGAADRWLAAKRNEPDAGPPLMTRQVTGRCANGPGHWRSTQSRRAGAASGGCPRTGLQRSAPALGLGRWLAVVGVSSALRRPAAS